MQAANRVAVNTGILYGRMAVTVAISLYSTRLILNALGAEDFGLFNVVGGAIAMLGFLNASMSAATQRYMSFAHGSGESSKIRQIFNVSMVLHLAIAVLVSIVLEVAGYFLFENVLNIAADRLYTAKLIYQFMVISTIFTVISVPYDAVINARENMLLFAVIGIIESILKLIIAFYILYTVQDKLIVYGFSMAALSIFLLLLRILYCQRKYEECKLDLKNQYSKTLMKDMTGFAGWSLSGSVSSMFAHYGQNIVLNMFFGTAVNASQGIASQVSGQIGVFAATMMKALNPVIAKSEGANNRAYMLKASMFGSKAAFFLLMLFVVPIVIEMPTILKFWLGDVPEYAIIFCRLLLLRDLLGQLFVPLKSSINAVGNIRRFNLYYSVITVLPVGLAYILFMYNFPPQTLYYLFLVYEVAISVTIIYFAKVECELPVSYFLKSVVFRCITAFLLATLISIIPVFLFANTFTGFFLVLIFSLLSFAASMWLIGYSSDERKFFILNLSLLLSKIRLRIITK